ncbi:MAG: DUF2079 domain-containing protein [Anaerolineae bacterium]|nr:DUF2079 domain-containing protein [Anaerolineae bacterium]MDW8100156.1 DUF2079 domain-containing protein [Anaerolineae bacterium]
MVERSDRKPSAGFEPVSGQRWAVIVLWGLILAYTAGFSVLSIRPHLALKTHMADLGQMDLAIWNTAHGRFVQEIKGEQISTRLTDHVEPIFALVSLVFWVWDDVRALLVLQSAVIALGAWPVYQMARARLRALVAERWVSAAGIAFALVYLLFPALEAANLAEFHAAPLAVLPILLALWYTEQGRWVRFTVASLVVAAVKEEMALLSFLLGVWAMMRAGGRWAGLVVACISLAWFGVAVFVIIPAHAAPVYGEAQSVYFQRYGALGDSATDIARSLITKPALVWAIITEPARLRYLGGLLASVGGLALLGPELLLLSAPILAANLLSAYPAQYSGELHYSAPLVPYFVVAAIVGTARAVQGLSRRWQPALALGLVLGWLLLWSVGYHRVKGWTPLGGEFRWPEITEHHRLAERFFRQIPSDAPVSVTTALYPHLSHRERIYKFPALGDAAYVLLEVNGTTDMHPADLRRRFDELLASRRFCIRDAADGYVLLGPPAQTCASQLPDEFFSFARGRQSPTYPTFVDFAGLLTFRGYDIVDDGKRRLTQARTYWEALQPLPEGLSLWPFFVTADGHVAEDPSQRPPVATLWYPPERWRPGEIIVVETVPWFLPDRWALAVAVYRRSSGTSSQPNRVRLPVVSSYGARVFEGTWAVFPPFVREGRRLRLLTESDWPARWKGDHALSVGTAIELAGARVPPQAKVGEPLLFDLLWRVVEPIGRDYTVFVHLRDGEGQTVAQADATPAWFGPAPTTGWQTGWQPDAHRLELPADLPTGEYTLVIGLYDPVTGERLPVRDVAGGDAGNEIRLATVRIQESW